MLTVSNNIIKFRIDSLILNLIDLGNRVSVIVCSSGQDEVQLMLLEN